MVSASVNVWNHGFIHRLLAFVDRLQTTCAFEDGFLNSCSITQETKLIQNLLSIFPVFPALNTVRLSFPFPWNFSLILTGCCCNITSNKRSFPGWSPSGWITWALYVASFVCLLKLLFLLELSNTLVLLNHHFNFAVLCKEAGTKGPASNGLFAPNSCLRLAGSILFFQKYLRTSLNFLSFLDQ